MKVLFSAVGLFLFSFLAHLIIWKVRLPRQQIKALLMIFGATLALWAIAFGPRSGELGEIVHVALFYGSISLCYVITYSAIEADSPTLSLIRHVDTSGRHGISSKEVHEFLEGRPFIKARMAALIHDGLLREENGRYFVAGRGSPFFRLILAFRRLYGSIERGG